MLCLKSQSRKEVFQLIRNLEIENFRCFKSAIVRDARKFNVITGPNGSGKTALLEAIFLAGGNTAEIYIRTSMWRGREEFVLPVAPSHMVSLLEDYFHQFDMKQTLRIWFDGDHQTGEREIRLVAEDDEVLTLPLDGKSELASSQPTNVKFFWKTPKGVVEAKPESSPAGLRLTRPEDAYFMVFLSSMNVGGAKDNADRFSQLSSKNLEEPVVNAVRRIFPYVTGLTVLSTGNSSSIYATVRGLTRKIPIGLVSFGINKFVSILAAIAAAPNGAVLIDEVETGWYYENHQKMWEAITVAAEENRTQLFVTTHSKEFLERIAPTVASDEKNYRLIRMEKTNGESKLKEFSGREFGSAILSGEDVR